MYARAIGLALTLSVGAADLALAQDAAVKEGMKVFAAQKCSVCHSVAGEGNKKLPLDGVGQKLSEAQIREWIVDPAAAGKKVNSVVKPAMRAYPKLPAAELQALVAYVQSLK